jgi:hypothetical protein
MPDSFKRKEILSFKVVFQLIAGILFLIIGIYILLTNFENNYVLVGATKYLFGGILCLYGMIRIGRVYFNLKASKKDNYENDED